MFKKSVVLFLALAVIAFSSVAYAAGMSDVGGHHNREAIQYLYEGGVISGYPDGTFKPDQAVNRAELLKILVVGKRVSESEYHSLGNCFPDVTDEWFAPFVCYAMQEGWVDGYPDGTFKPDQTVNKVEAIKMLVNSQGYGVPLSVAVDMYDDVDNNQWYAPFVNAAFEKGLLEESGNKFGVDGGMTRAGISENIYRAMIINQYRLGSFHEYSEGMEVDTEYDSEDLRYTGDRSLADYIVMENYMYDVLEACIDVFGMGPDSLVWDDVNYLFQWTGYGEILAEPYEGWEFVSLILPCGENCDYSIYSFAWNKDSGELVYLPRHSIGYDYVYIQPLMANVDSEFGLEGLELGDLEKDIDEESVHNGLVDVMDGVLVAEGGFFEEYWLLEDGNDTSYIVAAYSDFVASFVELNIYFALERFASTQEVFRDEFYDYYKPFMIDYITSAGEFVDKVEAEGFTVEAMESYFPELDKFTEDFIETHNRLIETINEQADL